jgi:hypothetical protein
MKSNDMLKNKSFPIPDEVLELLKINYNKYSNTKNNAGVKRAEGFLKEKRVNFKEMERLKNFFNTYDGEDQQEFDLSGGEMMRDFVINGVDRLRQAIDNVKRAEMKGGKENAYKSKHEKDNDNANPSNVNKANIQTKSDEIMSNKTTYSESYQKEIADMRYLIEYMDNNKNKI